MLREKNGCPIKKVCSTPLGGRGHTPYQQSARSSVFTFDVATPTPRPAQTDMHVTTTLNLSSELILRRAECSLFSISIKPHLQFVQAASRASWKGWKGARIIISFLWLFSTAFAYLQRLPFGLRLFKFTIGVPAR